MQSQAVLFPPKKEDKPNNCVQLDCLVVDDNAMNRKVLIRPITELLGKGATIVEAENGQESVDKVKDKISKDHRDFDVIIMDFQMPIMTGDVATHQIRLLELSLFSSNRSRIVTCSTEWDKPYNEADAVLGKPVRRATLEKIFEEVREHQPRVGLVK